MYNEENCLRPNLKCVKNGSSLLLRIQNGDGLCVAFQSLKETEPKKVEGTMSKKDVEKIKEDTKNNLLSLQNAMPDTTTADSYTPEQAAEINQKVSTYIF